VRAPLGITFLSIYYAAAGIVTMASGALCLLDMVEVPRMYLFMDDIAGLFMVVYGLLLMLIGWGLYNFRRWAWLLALSTNALSVPLALMYADFLVAFINAAVAAYLFLQHGYYLRARLPKPEKPMLPRAPVLGHFVRPKDLRMREYKFVKRRAEIRGSSRTGRRES